MAEDPLKTLFIAYVKKKRRDALLFLAITILPAIAGTVLFFWLLWLCCTLISESAPIQGLLFGALTAVILFVGFREYSNPTKTESDDDNPIPGVHLPSWRFTSSGFIYISSPLGDLTGNILASIPTLLFQLVFSIVSTFSLFQSSEITDHAFNFLPREKEYLGRDDLERQVERNPKKTKKALFLLCKIRFLKMIRRNDEFIFRRTITFDEFLESCAH